jgi:hypothetical protein
VNGLLEQLSSPEDREHLGLLERLNKLDQAITDLDISPITRIKQPTLDKYTQAYAEILKDYKSFYAEVLAKFPHESLVEPEKLGHYEGMRLLQRVI